MTLIYIILATFSITLCVLVGALIIFLNHKNISKISLYLVALSAGSLMGAAYLHLLPEALESLDAHVMFGTVLVSFVSFYILEKVIHWKHCHNMECTTHSFGYINLVGDSIHNFIDGVIIAGAFIAGPAVGITATIAIAIHEVPQEIGDYGVLIHSGFNKRKALLLNYLTALTVVLGGVVGYFAFNRLEHVIPYLLPIAAGGFIYLSASDLIPELKKEKSFKTSVATFAIFILGITFIYFMTMLENGH